ncbi:MAG: hypothetical protein Q8O67_03310 [Deltaproteobacteria bacterium]|nr:hypothetical protein [Deltaproteobacteria bacterium]
MMSTLLLCLIAAAPAPERLFVFDLKTEGVDAKLVSVLEQALVEEADAAGYDAVSGDELRALLDVEATKQLTGCVDEACLAEIADGMGARVLLSGSVTRVAGRTSVALTLFDSHKAKVLARESFEVTQSAKARDEIRPAARRLLGVDAETSALPTVLVTTGSIAAAVGAVVVVVGVVPLVGALNNQEVASSATDPAAAGVAFEAYTRDSGAWNSWGLALTIVGSAVVVGGISAIAVGATQ